MPALTPEAFARQVASKRLAPIYLLVGEDLTLMDRAVAAIEGTVDEADRAFAVERLYAGEPGGAPLEIVSAARTLPMLGDRRIVIVLRAERLLKPKRGGGADADVEEEPAGATESGAPADVSAIEDYLASPPPTATLVFVASDIDRSRRVTKRLIDKAQVVVFAGLDVPSGDPREARRQAVAVVEDELGRLGKQIEPEALRLIVARSGGAVTKLRHDAVTVATFVGDRKRITAADVIEVVSDPNAVEDDWAVVNAISNGDVARALLEAGRRFDRGDSAHALVGQLRWWVSNRLVASEPSCVHPALAALLRTDLALKSSGGDERVLVERLVVELTR